MRLLAVFSDYADLVAGLRARAEQLDVSNATLDEVAGLPTGYGGKVLGSAGKRTLGRISLGPLLAALGAKLALIEDPEGLARMRLRLTRRSPSGMRRGKLPRCGAVLDGEHLSNHGQHLHAMWRASPVPSVIGWRATWAAGRSLDISGMVATAGTVTCGR
jgi:hypothetical protein